MPVYQTPGVYVESVLTDPARVLRTGVPVFLGLIMAADLHACNARLPEGRQFGLYPFSKAQALRIVRKQDHMRLPPRSGAPADDLQISDPSSQNFLNYLRAGSPMPETARAGTAPAGAQANTVPGDPANSGAPAISTKPQRFTMWPQFKETYGDLERFGFLTHAVRGFFENEGDLCYVQVICFETMPDGKSLAAALDTLAHYDEYDLVCVPDLAWLAWAPGVANTLDMAALQGAILEHCETTGDRMAILDALPGADSNSVLGQRRLLAGDNGALYYPWVRVAQGPASTHGCVPPCGHVAGVYNRCDRRTGVHKAPANELLEGTIELERTLSNADQAPLNEAGVNCLRVFPRRGIRVWGARTLSNLPEWRFVNVRRIFLTAGRWIERNMDGIVFEPHTPRLWERVVRDLTVYFSDLARRGALLGTPSGVAFYVKCDAETNPPELRENGQIVTEIGLAAAPPTEFIRVRIIHGPAGVQIEGPV